MKKGEYAVYNISVTGLVKEGLVKEALEQTGLPQSSIQQQDDTFSIPRLCTFWRGDDEEHAWQDGLRTALLKADGKARITISAAPWEVLPNYPQGDLTL